MAEIKFDKRNYRKHNDRNKELIRKSLNECGAGRSIVIDNNNEIIAGNGIYEQAQELGIKTKIIETDGSELVVVKRTDLSTDDEKRKKLAVMDNSTSDSSEFDLELLKEDFEIPELQDFGIDIEEIEIEEEKHKEEKNKQAEEYINEATKKACGEIVEQYDRLDGFSFITKHTAKIQFIKFVYYGKEYERYNSIAFHPLQFKTSGDNDSAYNGLKRVAEGEINPERLRFVTGDSLKSIYAGSLAFSGCKMPLDFPTSLARDLIDEFAERGKVLDPCSGWGGRLIGFLASSAVEYQGVDASPNQVNGDLDIYETFKDVVDKKKKVSIVVSPFEKYENKEDYYDLVLTSPPYFDREKYLGGEQSHNYSNYEVWKESFYSVLIEKAYKSLKKRGIMCLQVGSQYYPLLKDGKKIAKEKGFKIKEVRATDMKNNFNQTEEKDGEVVLICEK
ncbi:MAG: DNA methyltransferase [Acutalibacteraceae bacterium]|nr:DNA methyltransferase [Acutalibacteraceae bacterium]